MKIELSENPNAQFTAEDKTLIDCDVVVDGEHLRYTANSRDVEPSGRALYAILMLTPDKIAPYVAPPTPKPKTATP